jgi:hypothetical protein
MKPIFFSSWQVYDTGIRVLLKGVDAPDGADVWIGADGSYAIGDAADIFDADPDTDLEFWTHAGTVVECRD